MAEDEMVGWHHQLSGHKFEQTLGDSERQGGLLCCSPWGRKELEQQPAASLSRRSAESVRAVRH